MRVLAERRSLEPATVWRGGADAVDATMRQAERCAWLRPDCEWVHARLDAIIADAAARLDLRVEPIFEPIQFVRYRVGGHFQLWHSDAGGDRHGERQVSVSVELSDAADYDGGVLEIAPMLGVPRSLPRGGARVFPSRAVHRVTPVMRGRRDALVAWAGARSDG